MSGRPKRAADLARLSEEPELVGEVWRLLEEGVALARICLGTGLGKAALLEWLDQEGNAERAALARARAARSLVDEALVIADESMDAKLRISQRNWIAERFDRAQFGQKVEHQVTATVTHQHLMALRDRKTTLPRPGDVVDVVAKTLEQQLLEL